MTNENAVSLWRQILRGFSQCAFQENEMTGVAFVIAVTIFNWQMAICYVVSVSIATLVARNAPVPFLASGFVLASWFILFLGWLNSRFADKPSLSKPRAIG